MRRRGLRGCCRRSAGETYPAREGRKAAYDSRRGEGSMIPGRWYGDGRMGDGKTRWAGA